MTTKLETPSEALARLDATVDELCDLVEIQAANSDLLMRVCESLSLLLIEKSQNVVVETLRRQFGSFPLSIREKPVHD